MSEFLKIKGIIDKEKTLKVQGETRRQTLFDESDRVLANVKQDTGYDIAIQDPQLSRRELLDKAAEKGEQIAAEAEKVISEQILQLKEILDTEGRKY